MSLPTTESDQTGPPPQVVPVKAAAAVARGIRADAWQPRVWVLLGEGAGGNAQMQTLAGALGWPFETKRVRYNPLNYFPNLLLGESSVSVDWRRSDRLAPPWPDLVIAASRQSAPVARWIKRRSGGRTCLVHLFHTQAPLHHFDLVVTTPQYRLPVRANILHNMLPLNPNDATRLQEAAGHWAPRFTDLPRPRIALLVGGDSASYRLTPENAASLAKLASRSARQSGGSLLVTTSRRTPKQAEEALYRELDCPHYFHSWQSGRDQDNPYSGFLALADRFIVTADSASLVAEACNTGRPVELFNWPQLCRWRDFVPLPAGLLQWMIYWGLIKPRRDFDAFYHCLTAQGWISPLGERGLPVQDPPDELRRTADRVHRLMAARFGAMKPDGSRNRDYEGVLS